MSKEPEDLRAVVKQVKEEVNLEVELKEQEIEKAKEVTDGRSKRKSTSFSLPQPHIDLLGKLSEIDNKSRSEVLVEIIEFQAKLIPYRQNLEKIKIQKGFLTDWKQAMLYALEEHFGADQRLKEFDQKLKQAVQSITLASENMLKLTTLQEYLKQLASKLESQVDTAKASMRSLEDFTDQFGLKKGILSIRQDLEKIDNTLKNMKFVAGRSDRISPSTTMELEKITDKTETKLLKPDPALADMPDEIFDMVG